MQLTTSLIRLGATPRDKNEAIRQVAALLAENGKVAPEYVEGMFAREAQENTYLGNGVAIPHGTPQSRHLIRHRPVGRRERNLSRLLRGRRHPRNPVYQRRIQQPVQRHMDRRPRCHD